MTDRTESMLLAFTPALLQRLAAVGLMPDGEANFAVRVVGRLEEIEATLLNERTAVRRLRAELEEAQRDLANVRANCASRDSQGA